MLTVRYSILRACWDKINTVMLRRVVLATPPPHIPPPRYRNHINTPHFVHKKRPQKPVRLIRLIISKPVAPSVPSTSVHIFSFLILKERATTANSKSNWCGVRTNIHTRPLISRPDDTYQKRFYRASSRATT